MPTPRAGFVVPKCSNRLHARRSCRAVSRARSKPTAAFAFLAATGIALAGVDANTATRSELESISGIGPATSARIVEERRKRPFADTRDLMRRVKGIGEARLARMVAAGLGVGGNGVIVTTGGLHEPAAPRAGARRAQAPARTAKGAER